MEIRRAHEFQSSLHLWNWRPQYFDIPKSNSGNRVEFKGRGGCVVVVTITQELFDIVARVRLCFGKLLQENLNGRVWKLSKSCLDCRRISFASIVRIGNDDYFPSFKWRKVHRCRTT